MPALIDPAPTQPRDLDEAVARLAEAAPRWARAPLPDRLALARALLRGIGSIAERSVAAACAAKGIALDSPPAGEEWMSGPWITARILRQLARSLAMLARNGNTPVGPTDETDDGRLTVRVFPASHQDRLLFLGVRADVHLEEGVDEAELHASRARFHKAPDHAGRVCLVLGAGNVNAIPPTDVAYKLFNEGKVCLLKMNPVNAYLGPLLEEAFAEAIRAGFVAIVYGGADEGAYLASHPGVDEVHVTGSERTHDALVWGPPGPERAERMARGQPLLAKPITSELGSISPVLVVPGPWDGGTLGAQAESVAAMVTYNAGFNCNAGRILLTPRGWGHRDAFLAGVEHFMALSPPRRPWYPGTTERYARLVEGRPAVRKVAQREGTLPWTLLTGLDPEARDPAYTTESFCAVLAEAPIASTDPLEYLDQAVRFANERLWGTLAANVVVHPRTLADPTLGPAVERAIRALRYGTVAVNCWAGYGFAFGTAPWGGHPGASATDIQSGRGFVHNTLMLERIEKCVVRHPVRTFPKPPPFPSHRTTHVLGRRLAQLEIDGGWREVPGIVAAAVRG